MRYAIFETTDPSAVCLCIMVGSEANILLNVPSGGTYKQVSDGVTMDNCPTLGELTSTN